MKFYTTSEVAKLCNVHRNTIIGAIRKGLLRIHRTPGGHARISQEDLDEFCHKRSLPTTALVARNNRVLLVDEEPAHSALLLRGLREAAYMGESAANLFMAGFMLARFQPNVLILDANAFGGGAALCRQIRGLPRFRELPIIGMSGGLDAAEREAFVRAGLNDLLTKPFDLDDLIAAIVRLIGPVVRGASGRATPAEPTRRIDRMDADPDRATRKAGPRRGFDTSVDGVLAGPESDELAPG
ncbi:MAG: excisionase family DNA-binding protein [Planctomycetes bacterium]|nr:excisionase family DNA-binding protein [Planctomycetota bacterium]